MRWIWIVLPLSWSLAAPAIERNDSGATVAPRKGGCTIDLPAGWNYDTASLTVLASYDGPLLGSILLQMKPHKDAFKAIKKASSPEALPEDLAESFLANFQAGGTASEVEVVSIEPAELAGQPAFRLHLRYRLPEAASGARVEQIVLGTPTPRALLLLEYKAPALHFFAKSLPVFEEVAKTVALQADQ